MKTSKIRPLFCAAASAALLLPVGAPAMAAGGSLQEDTVATSHNSTASTQLSDAEKEELFIELHTLGVNAEVANRLIAKLESGDIWDSLKPGSTPISTVTNDYGTETEVIATYADGSVMSTTTSNPEAAKTATEQEARSPGQERSIHGCNYSSGGAYASYWRNCTADLNYGIVRLKFNFDFENIREMGARITDYRNKSGHIIGGSLSDMHFDRINDRAVRLSSMLATSIKGIPAGWTIWIQANVSGSHAWTTQRTLP